jgi:exodeoxyribonuclease VII large subunit
MNDRLFQFLLDEAEHRPMTVSELASEIRGTLERSFANVWVEGEVVNFTRASSGHWYFSLNDGVAQIRCACFKGTNFRIRFTPQNGITVRLRGRVTSYEARGELQLIVDSLEPSGEGALAAAYEQIRSRLEREGLFAEEIKRPIPHLPRRVAVVTSRTGAAFHDIHNVLTRRAKSVSILLVPALVQGEGAADSVRRAIMAVNAYNHSQGRSHIDVMIVGRGGGSAEDLWAFNDEALARAIRASEIPIISAVGHEIDWTISDLVADLRAATPSAAAEIVAGREQDILSDLSRMETALTAMMQYKMLSASSAVTEASSGFEHSFDSLMETIRDRFAAITNRLTPAKLRAKAVSRSNELGILEQRKRAAIEGILASKNQEMLLNVAKLDALSPLGVLTRGYSIVQSESGKIVRDAASVESGDKLKIRLERGKLDAEVLSIDN